ncbi:MAG: hypothetical protein ACREA0_22880 [bacterium]
MRCKVVIPTSGARERPNIPSAARLFAIAVNVMLLAACGSANPADNAASFLGNAGNCLMNIDFEQALVQGPLEGHVEVVRSGNQLTGGSFMGTRRGNAVRLTVAALPERGVWEGQLIGSALVLNLPPTPPEFRDFAPPCEGGNVLFVEAGGDQKTRERIGKLLLDED